MVCRIQQTNSSQQCQNEALGYFWSPAYEHGCISEGHQYDIPWKVPRIPDRGHFGSHYSLGLLWMDGLPHH